MKFGTWMQINVETEKEWPADFRLIKDMGFDYV